MQVGKFYPGAEEKEENVSASKRVCFWIIFFIRFYQWIKKSILPATCRFYPSCSEYSIMAFKKHGFFKGVKLSLKRILRCNPFSKGGFDPLL